MLPNNVFFLIAAGIGAVLSMFGDLCASAVKRHCGVKDFGNIFPGHGGFLDRFDSVVFIKHLINWTLAYNKGAAWSMCSEHTDVLAFVSLFASFIIVFFMKDFNIKNKPIFSIGLALILGGTIGNMIDRFLSVKGVIDFIEFGFMDFPIFNLADTFLVIGTIALMISIIFTDIIIKKEEKNEVKSGECND